MKLNVNSVAALKRIPPGTRLRVVSCLTGPCDAPRVFDRAQSNAVVMKTPEGRNSWLYLTKGLKVEPTERGFRVVDPDCDGCGHVGHVEYVFDEEVSP